MLNIIVVVLLSLGGNTGASVELRPHISEAPTFPDDLEDCWTEMDHGRKTEVCLIRGVRVILLPTIIVETKPTKRRKKDHRVLTNCAGSTNPLCGLEGEVR